MTGDEVKPVYFKSIDFEPPDDPRRLIFTMARGAGAIPNDMRLLRSKLNEAARIISIFFKEDKKTRHDLFMQLHRIADLGCRGDGYSVELAAEALESLQQEVVDIAQERKNSLQRRYLKVMLAVAAPCALAGVVVLLSWSALESRLPAEISYRDTLGAIIVSAFLVPAGAAFGVWLEFALRVGKLDFERLLYFDTERWDLSSRMSITVGLSFAFAFLLGIQAIQVGMFNVLLNDFIGSKPWLAFAIGLVSGLAFPIVRDYVQQVKPVERAEGGTA